jgi:hypothetical protein
VSELLLRDVTRVERELGRSHLTGLPSSMTVGELLDHRVRTEIATYNEQPGRVLVGLVQPADAIRHSDGFRMRQPRELDVGVATGAVREAVALGMLALVVDGERITDLERRLDLDGVDEVLVLHERPVIAEFP